MPESRDLADDDLFQCTHCGGTFDIEESIETPEGFLICEACQDEN